MAGYRLAYAASVSSTTPPSSPSKSIPLFTRTSPPANPTRARTPRSQPRTSSTGGTASVLDYSLTAPDAVNSFNPHLRPFSLLTTTGYVRAGTAGSARSLASARSEASSAFTGVPTTAHEALVFGGQVA